jgi:hypothetical protein
MQAWVILAGLSFLVHEMPCESGPAPGHKPAPYAFVVATGPQRGQLTCYVCETGDRPAVIVFARQLGEPLGKLVRRVEQAGLANKSADLRAWVTFLGNDQAALDRKVVEWSRQHGLATVPSGVFEDVQGPPAYRLATDADITVLLCQKQKVVARFALRAGELTPQRADDIIKALSTIGVGR